MNLKTVSKENNYKKLNLPTKKLYFQLNRQEQFCFIDGIREKSHYCIGVYLEKYVDNENLEEEYTLLFDRMRSARNTNQYSFQTAPSLEEVKSGIQAAEKFIKRIQQLLKDITTIK